MRNLFSYCDVDCMEFDLFHLFLSSNPHDLKETFFKKLPSSKLLYHANNIDNNKTTQTLPHSLTCDMKSSSYQALTTLLRSISSNHLKYAVNMHHSWIGKEWWECI